MPKPRSTLLLLVPALAALLVAGGCNQGRKAQPQGTPGTGGAANAQKGQAETPPADRPFRQLTPQAQADISELINRVINAQPDQRMELATRLTRFGEAAVPQLMQNLSHSVIAVRITCAYVLGLNKDPRSFDALYRATFDPVEDVRFEAGTALLRGGDDRAIPLMISGLEHPDPRVRARSLLVLEGRTGSTFEYRPDGTVDDRAAAVARWRAWYERQRTETH